MASAPPLLIVGASARAAAESAVLAGFEPLAVDLFADRDLQAIARVLRCPAEQYPHALVQLARKLAPAGTPLLLTGAMENHLEAAAELERWYPPVGPSVSAMAKAREPALWQAMPSIPGVRVPRIAGAPPCVPHTGSHDGPWLLKPRRGAAGRRVTFASSVPLHELNRSSDDTCYLQEFIPGIACSFTFFARDSHVHLLGATLQIVGDPAFGASGFEYAGSLAPLALSPPQQLAGQAIGQWLAQSRSLRGLFGVDFILSDAGIIHPIEINPRYTASVEVIERVTGTAALAKLQAVTQQHSPVCPATFNPVQAAGKAIVRAKRTLAVPDLWQRFNRSVLADVPEAGQVVPAHQPICTLLATGPSPEDCLAQLHDRAAELYTFLDELHPFTLSPRPG